MPLRCATLVALAATLCCSGRSGLRRVEHLEASANVRLDVDYQRFEEAPGGSDVRDTTSAGVAVRGIVGAWGIGAALGVDGRVGAGLQGGFAYRGTLRPLGLGVHVGRFASLAITGGAGIDGVTEHVGFAVRWPLEAALTLELGHRVHLDAWAELGWISAGDEREAGAASAPFADELAAGAALRIGRGALWRRRARWGNGYYLGGTYAELLGVRRVGLVFGYGLNTHHRRD